MLKKLLVLPFLLISGQSRAGGPGLAPAIEVPAQESCQEHITATPLLTTNDWPKQARAIDISAYVVIAYVLDGSGKAKNPEVMGPKPDRFFVDTSLGILERTDFAVGVKAPACAVRTYGAARRAER